jgi:hypothetical protein
VRELFGLTTSLFRKWTVPIGEQVRERVVRFLRFAHAAPGDCQIERRGGLRNQLERPLKRALRVREAPDAHCVLTSFEELLRLGRRVIVGGQRPP